MKSLSKKYIMSLAIVWCSTLLLLAIGYILLLRPQSKAVDVVKKQLLLNEEEYNFAQEAKSEQTKAKLQNILRDARDTMDSVSVNSGNAAALIFEINQIARKLMVEELTSKRNESFSCELIEGCKNLGQLWINVSFSADFPQFAKFINTLERHKPFVFVETFDIDRGTKKSSKPKVKMGLAFFVGKELEQNKP
jgi:hypothetical protein